MHEIEDLIYVNDNVLTEDFCYHVIRKFNDDLRQTDGHIGSGYAPEIKQSKDLFISNKEEWESEDQIFADSLSEQVKLYTTYCKSINSALSFGEELNDSGYQIQRTEPKGFYTWHSDDYVNLDEGERTLTFIWYLNDIELGGGYTEFLTGRKVYPRKGRFVLFPSTWTYLHRGYPPREETKYLVTGWLHKKIHDGKNEK